MSRSNDEASNRLIHSHSHTHRSNSNPLVHAWDTEVVGLDLEVQSPVGHGTAICASFYSGPNIDYGTGATVWIDSLTDPNTLLEFKSVLEDTSIRKVWHNYGFDRHILMNSGINAKGFFGDTMHMARLCDTSLKKSGGYSLAALSNNKDVLDSVEDGKLPLMQLFGRPKKKKNGEDSKVKVLPPLNEVQESTDLDLRRRWIEYSTRDAEVTWRLYFALRKKLSDNRKFRWEPQSVCFKDIQFDRFNALESSKSPEFRDTELEPPVALELYERVIMPFGELLTDLERNGIVIDVTKIEQAGQKAALQRQEVIKSFKSWAVEFTGKKDMIHFNVHSDMQKVQLLFGLPKKLATTAGSGQPVVDEKRSSDVRTAAEQADQLQDEAATSEVDDNDEIDLLQSNPPTLEPIQAVSSRKSTTQKRKKSNEPQVGGGGGGGGGGPVVGLYNNRVVSRFLNSRLVDVSPWLVSFAHRFLSTNNTGNKDTVPRRSRRTRLVELGSGSDLEFVPGGSWLSSDSDSNGSDLEWGQQEDHDDDALVVESSWSTPNYSPRPPIGPPLEELVEFECENIDGFIPAGAKAGSKPKKKRPFFVPSLYLPVTEKTIKGRASGSAGAVKKLLGKPFEQGPAYKKLIADGSPPDVAKRACSRINDLLEISQIDTTIETFIEPLLIAGIEQIDDAITHSISTLNETETTVMVEENVEGKDSTSTPPEPIDLSKLSIASGKAVLEKAHAQAKVAGSVSARITLADAIGVTLEPRIHCSLNLNTETGRLSARRPNMQNQPSLDRDKFRIRSAFIAPPGKSLVVADYGQLELRVLAHLSNCASMIAAFEAGGDFHSRTAMGMYPYVKEAVDKGSVLLEWDEEKKGKPPKPLLKDAFKEERRKAKVLNFSIAYGKTAFGLAKDWEISHQEAERTVALWYGDRPEVQSWQERTKELARRTKRVYTILGRHRDLPDINTRMLKAHNERAAINTPIQGSAADIVMCAMLKIWRDKELAELGYRMMLQVHDEIILEGPTEHAEKAMERVVMLMGSPFDSPLLVDLIVDAKVVKSWGDAK